MFKYFSLFHITICLVHLGIYLFAKVSTVQVPCWIFNACKITFLAQTTRPVISNKAWEQHYVWPPYLQIGFPGKSQRKHTHLLASTRMQLPIHAGLAMNLSIPGFIVYQASEIQKILYQVLPNPSSKSISKGTSFQFPIQM